MYKSPVSNYEKTANEYDQILKYAFQKSTPSPQYLHFPKSNSNSSKFNVHVTHKSECLIYMMISSSFFILV